MHHQLFCFLEKIEPAFQVDSGIKQQEMAVHVARVTCGLRSVETGPNDQVI